MATRPAIRHHHRAFDAAPAILTGLRGIEPTLCPVSSTVATARPDADDPNSACPPARRASPSSQSGPGQFGPRCVRHRANCRRVLPTMLAASRLSRSPRLQHGRAGGPAQRGPSVLASCSWIKCSRMFALDDRAATSGRLDPEALAAFQAAFAALHDEEILDTDGRRTAWRSPDDSLVRADSLTTVTRRR